MKPMLLPNRIRAPLTADEAMAEQHGGRLHLLREIAQETGNRPLAGIVRAMSAEERQQAKESRRRAAGAR
jgi:hypothetical protein